MTVIATATPTRLEIRRALSSYLEIHDCLQYVATIILVPMRLMDKRPLGEKPELRDQSCYDVHVLECIRCELA